MTIFAFWLWSFFCSKQYKNKVLWLSGLVDIQASLCPRRFVTGIGDIFSTERKSLPVKCRERELSLFLTKFLLKVSDNGRRARIFLALTYEEGGGVSYAQEAVTKTAKKSVFPYIYLLQYSLLVPTGALVGMRHQL